MTFGTLERVELEAKMGRNLPSLTLHVGCGLCKAQWGHMELWAALWTLLPVPAFLSTVASVPTTQYWSVVRVWARQSAQWGDVPVCRGAMDSKQNVNVSGRKKKCGAPPSLRGGTFTRCYVRWALHLCVKMQSCLWAVNTCGVAGCSAGLD